MALFAALSYAVTQTGRGTGGASRETTLIAASRITQYAATVRTIVTRMVLTGTQPAAVILDPADTSVNGVFSANGGNLSYQDPPSNIGTADGGTQGTTPSSWGFKDMHPPARGYYIYNVGTNTDVTGRDAFAYLHDISLDVCQQINKGLSLTTTIPSTGVRIILNLNSGAGDNGPATAASDMTYDAFPGEPFACVKNWGVYDYYHAVIEQ